MTEKLADRIDLDGRAAVILERYPDWVCRKLASARSWATGCCGCCCKTAPCKFARQRRTTRCVPATLWHLNSLLPRVRDGTASRHPERYIVCSAGYIRPKNHKDRL
jgi:hypothetical protein